MRGRPEKDRGTVLLTTLLIMAVMAAVSVAIMDDIRFAVKRVINVGDYAQADWYLKGAEDFAESYITDKLAPLPPEVKNQLFTEPQIFTFPYEGGAMILDVRDGDSCFSLGSLITAAGAPDVVGGRQFTWLLSSLGWADNEARNLSGVLTDWIDVDSQRAPNGAEDGDYLRRTPPHRTANTALSSVMELRGLQGMTEEQYQSLRPYLCAREAGQKTKLNIETAKPIDAYVLSALLGGPEYFQAALRLITERPQNGYGTAETLKNALANIGYEGENPAFDQIIFAPQKLWIEVRVNYRGASRLAAYEYDLLDNGIVNQAYRGWGAESLRPVLTPEDDR